MLLWLSFYAAAASAQLTAHGDAVIDPSAAVRLGTGPRAHVFDEGGVMGTADINDDTPELRIDLAGTTCRRDRALDGARSHFVHFAPTDPATALGLLSFGNQKIVALAFANGCFRVTADQVRLSPALPAERALDDGEDGLYVSGSGTMLAFSFTDTVADSARVFIEAKPSMGPTVDVQITSCHLMPAPTPKYTIAVSATIDTHIVLLARWAEECTSSFPSSSFERPMYELALSQELAGELIEITCTGTAMPGRTVAAILPDDDVIDTNPANNLIECTRVPGSDAGMVGLDAAVADAAADRDAAARRDTGVVVRNDSSVATERFGFQGGGGCACSADRAAPPWFALAALLVWVRMRRR